MFFSIPLQVLFYLFCTITLLTACTSTTTSSQPPPSAQGAGDKCSGIKSSSKSETKNTTSTSYGLVADTDLWADVKKVLGDHCTGCHAKFAEYDTASTKIDNYIKLSDYDENDDGFMPKGSSKLSLEDRTTFILWRAAGMPKSGGSTDDIGEDDGSQDDGSQEGDEGEDSDPNQDDSSDIDGDGTDWGDDPPSPPKSDC